MSKPDDTYTIQGYIFPEYLEHEEMIEQVKLGMALLNEKCPGWQEELWMNELSLSSGHDCILGQTFGTFQQGVYELFHIQWNDMIPDADYNTIVNHGFVTSIDYRELDLVWKVLLQQKEETHG